MISKEKYSAECTGAKQAAAGMNLSTACLQATEPPAPWCAHTRRGLQMDKELPQSNVSYTMASGLLPWRQSIKKFQKDSRGHGDYHLVLTRSLLLWKQ